MVWLVEWSKTRLPWSILFLSAAGLVLSALYFQHVQDYLPCVKCIYQRTAVIGIAIAAALPMIYPHVVTRVFALVFWLYCAFEGFVVASEHIDVIFDDSMFVAPCPIAPNFPSLFPLHELLPAVFQGPGNCLDNSWQFLSLGMAEWMRIIFSGYFIVGSVVLGTYLIRFRNIK
ncbi:MAG: disulfide bond formation protein B [Pseudomonadota bacterium]